MKVPPLNDGGSGPPRLRLDLNVATIWGLPPSDDRPWLRDIADPQADFAGVRATGFEGMQAYVAAPVLRAGLPMTGLGRILDAAEAKPLAIAHRDQGMLATTLHVGTGVEQDDEAARLAEAVLEASVATGYPLLVETHRATMTQDIRRTLDLVERFPELRFNGDFAQWYTGHELGYGDIDAKLALIEPVVARTRFLHGRMGHGGASQVGPIGQETYAFHRHFRALWTRCFTAFLDGAAQGDVFVFAPELLPATGIVAGAEERPGYAQEMRGSDGSWREVEDRWANALELCAIARRCFAEAEGTHAAQAIAGDDDDAAPSPGV